MAVLSASWGGVRKMSIGNPSGNKRREKPMTFLPNLAGSHEQTLFEGGDSASPQIIIPSDDSLFVTATDVDYHDLMD
jgi:hypothetical protein